MASYRCYLLDASSKIQAVENIEADQDADALSKTGTVLEAQSQFAGAEVWIGSRLVGQLLKPSPSTTDDPKAA